MGTERRRRVLSIVAVFPLASVVLWHVIMLAAASGRRSFATPLLDGHGIAASAVLIMGLFWAPLMVHGVLGAMPIWKSRRMRSPAPSPEHDLGEPARPWAPGQLVSGLLTLPLLILHTIFVVRAAGRSPTSSALYDILRTELGRPPILLLYVFGISCLSLHLGRGIGRWLQTQGLALTNRGRRLGRIGGALIGIAFWLVSIDTLSHFAVGRTFLLGSTGLP